jgi:cell wall assembly regulator SMI1
MSLDQILDAHAILTGLLEAGQFDRANWWSPRWIPFLANGAGDHLCLDLEGTFTGNVGQLIRFWHDDAERWIEAGDLESWLGWYLTSLRDAAQERLDPDELVDVDFGSPSLPGYPVRASAGAG